MANPPNMIASAVIVPTANTDTRRSSASHENSLKRRRSSSSSPHSKRSKINTDYVPSDVAAVKGAVSSPVAPTATPSAAQAPSARSKTGPDEERKRGKRLFGALLGTLNQSSNSGMGRKRADIERKQQARLREKAQEQEEANRKAAENLNQVRRKQQKNIDEQSACLIRSGQSKHQQLTISQIRLRHSNTLSMAQFLRTTAEPRLYYKPYELLPNQKEQIRDQIEGAEEFVKQENSRLDRRSAHIPKALISGANDTLQDRKEEVDIQTTVSEKSMPASMHHSPNVEAGGMVSHGVEIQHGSEKEVKEGTEGHVEKDDREDNEELVVEAGEDSVIY